jgi:hypothetical protein
VKKVDRTLSPVAMEYLNWSPMRVTAAINNASRFAMDEFLCAAESSSARL